MSEVVFYTNPMSRGRIVRRMLEECGAQYRTEVVEYGASMKSQEYRRINPMGKVPALVYDGRVITETPAIVAFLAEVYPEAALAPPPAERQDYYRWLFFAAGPMEAAVTNQALGIQVPEDKRAFVGYGSLDQAVQTLAEVVGRTPYIAGSSYSAADLYVGSHIEFGLRFGLVPEQAVLRDYVTRLQQRSAWQRAAELDEALMPPKPAG